MMEIVANVDIEVDVDVLEGRLTSLMLPPSLSEPHDQPYPMQPYVTKLSQFHSFTNCDTVPYKLLTVGTGDSAMGRGMLCQGYRMTVRLYNGMMYDVQRTMYDV